MTSGNPLSLREGVLSSAETGVLTQVDGEWCWKGSWPTAARLQEIVASRLGRFDPDELAAMELLAPRAIRRNLACGGRAHRGGRRSLPGLTTVCASSSHSSAAGSTTIGCT